MSPAVSRTSTILNVVAYYAGWLACVEGAARGQWQLGALIGLALAAIHLGVCDNRRAELRLMLAVAVIGYAVDSAQTALGLLDFSSGQPAPWLAPLWIGVMWLLFATTLRYAFHWLTGRTAWAVTFGAIGGPAAFYAGYRLGAVAFHPTPGLSLLVLAIVWGVLFPLLLRLAAAIAGGAPGGYRFLVRPPGR